MNPGRIGRYGNALGTKNNAPRLTTPTGISIPLTVAYGFAAGGEVPGG